MISVKFTVGDYNNRYCIIGAELSSKSVAEHLFVNQKEREIGLALRGNFLGKDANEPAQSEAQELVARLYIMWKTGGEHGYSEAEIELMESETAVAGSNIHKVIRNILGRQQ